ncbi:glycosyltransferase family 2 protein [Pedobacter cryotolerans]|uniref:Glycosyltransferase family 2 protein n=1 Tax=Pedobacter cryotolerans TaxID=2571270 RepID=A0A4U1CDV9_9SPHI|nr:glycosyltransferase family A protein [Pedobacter cryotolerans]TKC03497.1 glycosyltransferase family 2 protein [Pedobacter cryotolerans]
MKVSVIIPAYNAQDTIITALNSVYNQTYRNIEIIVINDGSTDSTLEILNDFKNSRSENDIEIQIINTLNGGVSSARNNGLAKSKGELIALLDSDDEWLPNKLEFQTKYFDRFDFVAACRNNELIKFPYNVINNDFAIITLKKLLFRVAGHTSTAVFRKSIIEDVGFFDEQQSYSEDANYWMKIAKKYQMIILVKSLVITGGGKPSIGHSGLSANIKGMETGAQKNIDEMYDLKYINFGEFCFFKVFSTLKYIMRIIRL